MQVFKIHQVIFFYFFGKGEIEAVKHYNKYRKELEPIIIKKIEQYEDILKKYKKIFNLLKKNDIELDIKLILYLINDYGESSLNWQVVFTNESIGLEPEKINYKKLKDQKFHEKFKNLVNEIEEIYNILKF